MAVIPLPHQSLRQKKKGNTKQTDTRVKTLTRRQTSSRRQTGYLSTIDWGALCASPPHVTIGHGIIVASQVKKRWQSNILPGVVPKLQYGEGGGEGGDSVESPTSIYHLPCLPWIWSCLDFFFLSCTVALTQVFTLSFSLFAPDCFFIPTSSDYDLLFITQPPYVIPHLSICFVIVCIWHTFDY